MKNCIVTKLNGSIDDQNLPIFGAVIIEVEHVDGYSEFDPTNNSGIHRLRLFNGIESIEILDSSDTNYFRIIHYTAELNPGTGTYVYNYEIEPTRRTSYIPQSGETQVSLEFSNPESSYRVAIRSKYTMEGITNIEGLPNPEGFKMDVSSFNYSYNLIWLYLHMFNLTGEFNPKVVMNNLEILFLASNTKFDLGNLSKTPNLVAFNYLSSIPTTGLTGDLSSFSSLINLTSIGMGNCIEVTGSINSFSSCTNLVDLGLYNIDNFTGNINTAFSNCRKLRALNLGNSSAGKITGNVETLCNSLKNYKSAGETLRIDVVGTSVTTTLNGQLSTPEIVTLELLNRGYPGRQFRWLYITFDGQGGYTIEITQF